MEQPPIRWWPAAVIAGLMLGALGYFWLGDAASTQDRVMPTFPILFFGVLLLVLWLVLFSRLPGRRRLAIFTAVAVLVAATMLLVEITGVDGNLVPILGWRSSGERTFGSLRAAAGLGAAGAEDYPQFYGPRRDATLSGPRLARDWKARPPREIWRREVGEGWSSFAVVGDAAVTQEQRGDAEVVVRYELTTGAEVWVHSDDAPFNTTIGGSGPRATPTVVDGRVFTLGATGILNCLDLEEGRRIWSRNVLEDTNSRLAEWGLASSPLVVGDRVVVSGGRLGVPLAAYDRSTGEPAWTADGDQGTYTTPIVTRLVGREQVVVVNSGSVTGHDPASGEVLWRADWPASGERVAPPLVLEGDRLLVSAGYGQGSLLLRLSAEGDGIAVEQLWESRRLKSKFAPVVERLGVVYGLDDGILVALDPATGERLWKAGRYGHGQLILVGDLLLIQAENGDLVLVEANPDEHRELARIGALDGKTWNPPALAGRLLLARNNRQAVCYELPIEG